MGPLARPFRAVSPGCQPVLVAAACVLLVSDLPCLNRRRSRTE